MSGFHLALVLFVAGFAVSAMAAEEDALSHAAAALRDGRAAEADGLGQCLVEAHQHLVGGFTRDIGHHAQMGHWHAVAGAGQAQVLQGGGGQVDPAKGIVIEP